MKELTVQELQKKLINKDDFQFIDVREPHEYDICNLNADLIPMGSVLDRVDEISKDKMVIVHCKTGSRSGVIINELEKRFGFTNLYNLKGGIMAYAREIDETMRVY